MMPKLIAGAVTRQSRMWRLVAVFALVLATLMPSLTLAAEPEPFGAAGQITSITVGAVKPAGNSGRFVVVERQMSGALQGSLDSSFTLSYKANVELATQAGELHGTMKLDNGDVLNVNGTVQPLQWQDIGFGQLLPVLTMSGHWNFTNGAQGQGNFTAWGVFIPTDDGHIATLAGAFSLTGQWQP